MGDTKYKRSRPTSDDLYQLFTYAQYLGIGRSHLIYAAPVREEPIMPIETTGTQVVAHGISLENSSTHFLAQMASLAEAMSPDR